MDLDLHAAKADKERRVRSKAGWRELLLPGAGHMPSMSTTIWYVPESISVASPTQTTPKIASHHMLTRTDRMSDLANASFVSS